MRFRHLPPLLALLAIVGCGGDEESGTATSGSTGTSSSGEATALPFDQVEGFTLEYLQADAAVSRECKGLGWVEDEEQKQELAPFTGTTTTEVLTCDDVPYLAYLAYEDAAAATDGLGPALLPYLVADETTVVMPLVAIDEATASGYLEALKSECGCGEVVQPAK